MAHFETKNGKLFIDGREVLKAWESWSGWYWFATEFVQNQNSIIDGKVVKDDIVWFGLVQGIEEEWGDFSEGELKDLHPKVWEIPKQNLPFSGRRTQQGEATSPRFTKQCPCGNELEPAYHPELGKVFWNCFRCFPFFERATEEQMHSSPNPKGDFFIVGRRNP